MVIEAVKRLPLEKTFENRFFGPLGMTRSYLRDGIPREALGLARPWLIRASTTKQQNGTRVRQGAGRSS